MPTHQYRAYADSCLRAPRENVLIRRHMQASTRSYTRIVLRLRLQAEALAQTCPQDAPFPQPGGPPTAFPGRIGQTRRQFSRSSSRAPSPTESRAHSQQGHDGPSHAAKQARSPSAGGQRPSISAMYLGAHGYSNGSGQSGQFRSPLYRPSRAPLLRVFVPSPEGEWLSDVSVLECEQELQAVSRFLRVGDVVWDTAAGDEANVGRLIWDGAYLIVSASICMLIRLTMACSFRTWITRTRARATFPSTCTLSRSRRRTSIASYACHPPVIRLSILT